MKVTSAFVIFSALASAYSAVLPVQRGIADDLMYDLDPAVKNLGPQIYNEWNAVKDTIPIDELVFLSHNTAQQFGYLLQMTLDNARQLRKRDIVDIIGSLTSTVVSRIDQLAPQLYDDFVEVERKIPLPTLIMLLRSDAEDFQTVLVQVIANARSL